MLKRFWFRTRPGLGYGVTATSQEDAVGLLQSFGYPREGEELLEIIENINVAELDQKHVVPNAGVVVVRGVWFPRHGV